MLGQWTILLKCVVGWEGGKTCDYTCYRCVVGWEGGMTGDKKVILIICHARSLDHTSQMFGWMGGRKDM